MQDSVVQQEREMLLPASNHSKKLIQGRPTGARRLEPRTAK